MIAVTDADLTEHINTLREDQLAVVDIWASWCGPCKMYNPILEKLSYDTDVTVFSLDADANPQTMIDNQIMSIPTLLVYKGTKLVDKLVGVKPYMKLVKELEIFGLDTSIKPV